MENETLIITSREVRKMITMNSSYEELKYLLKGLDKEVRFYVVEDVLDSLERKKVETLNLKNRSLKTLDSKMIEETRIYVKQIKNLQKRLREVRDDLLIEMLPFEHKKELSIHPTLRREMSAYYRCLTSDYFMNEEIQHQFEKYSFDMYVYDKLSLLKEIRMEYDLEKSRLKEQGKNIIREFCDEIYKNTNEKISLSQKERLRYYLQTADYSCYEKALEKNRVARGKVRSILESLDQLVSYQHDVILKEEKMEKRREREDDYQEDYSTVFETEIAKKKKRKLLKLIEVLKQSDAYQIDSFLHNTMDLLDKLDNTLQLNFSYACYDILRKRLLFLKDQNLDKAEEEKQRRILKKWEQYFNHNIHALTEEEKPYQEDYYYVIMDSLLNEDRNYQYIRNLLKEVPEFRTARNSKGHITINLMDRYIVNMKYKLLNHKIPFLDPNYYSKVFETYFEYGNCLFPEEKEYLKNRINQFREYIKNKKYACSEDIYSQLDQMEQLVEFAKRKEALPCEKMDLELEDMLSYVNQHVKGYADLTSSYHQELIGKIEEYKSRFKKEYGKEPSVEMMYDMLGFDPNELRNTQFAPEVFSLENSGQYAYSVYYDEEGDTYLRFHILDVSSLFDSDSKKEKIIKEKQLKLNNHQFVFPHFKKGGKYPTITLQVPIYKNGKIGDMVPFKGIVEINEIYGDDDVYNYRNNPFLKQLVAAFRKLNLSDEAYHCLEDSKDIEVMMIEAINKGLGKMFEDYHIPYIYCNYPTDNEDLIRRNHNQVCHLLHKVPKKKAYQIFDVLDSPVEKAYSLDKGEDSIIEVNPYTYLGIDLQRLLKKIVSSTYDLTLKNRFEDEAEVQAFIQELNQSLGYVPELQKRRKRKKKKQY